MLIRFVVTNFLSFKEETEFNMLTGNFKIHGEHVYKDNSLEVLKAAAIYGANGAGKSNLIKAFSYLQDTVNRGKIFTAPAKHKVSQECQRKPTEFEIEFTTGSNTFSYGFSIDHDRILEEWLVRVHPSKSDEIIFNRTIKNNLQSLELHSNYLKTEQDRLRKELFEKEFLVIDKLFLSVAANLKENIITEISEAFHWIKDKLVIVFSNSRPAALVPHFLLGKKFHAFGNRLLCGFETGITKIDTETIPLEKFFGEDDKSKAESVIERLNAGQKMISLRSSVEDVIAVMENNKPVIKKLYTMHKGDHGRSIKFEVKEESEGTQRLMDFIPALYAMLFDNAVVLIDEIDKSIHPYLLKSLIAKVMGTKNATGQLIFTTHESNLLDLEIFRQDEIWFTEKNDLGATHLYSMSEYKPRYDLDIRKGYLNGRFGAIPFLGNLIDLKWEQYAEKPL